MANYFDTGILLTAGFSLSSQAPLDGRSVVELLTDLDTHIAENRAYEGMCVYVKENKKIYIYNGTTWEEFVGGGSSEKQIKDWVSGSSYLEGDYIYHEGEIYRCLTSNSDVDFDESNWEQVTYGIDELSKEDVERLLGLTEEELEAMASLISDTEVRIDKTYSSSKIYTDIQQCLEDSKTYTLEEIAKASTASYKIVTDVTDMTEERYLYLLNDGATNYDIYVVEADGTPTKIGSTQIDLSSYYTKEEVDELLEANAVDLSGYTKIFTSLDALGLTADATVEDVVNALKNGESFLAPVNTFTNYETIFPNKVPNDQWNKIHIIKGASLASSHIRCFSPSGTSEYLANVNNTNVVAWNDVSGLYTDISDAVIEKLGNEILKYPVGKYRINSTTTGDKFTDLPSNAEMKCGLIEINGTAVGKTPFTDAWVYRMYKFECLTGASSYIRRLNSGGTVGQIETDTGWRKEGQDIYASLSQLGLDTTATIDDIIAKMANNSMIVYKTDAFDYATQYENLRFATVTIIKQSVNRVQAIMTDKDTGNLYIARSNSSNKIVGWTKVCTTTAKDVPLTTVTTSNLSSDKITAGAVSYCVKNGVCYVYLEGIKCSEVGTSISILENMPKALITSGTHAGKSSSDATLTQYCHIVKNETTLQLHCYKAGDTGYCSFSYPISEE